MDADWKQTHIKWLRAYTATTKDAALIFLVLKKDIEQIDTCCTCCVPLDGGYFDLKKSTATVEGLHPECRFLPLGACRVKDGSGEYELSPMFTSLEPTAPKTLSKTLSRALQYAYERWIYGIHTAQPNDDDWVTVKENDQ